MTAREQKLQYLEEKLGLLRPYLEPQFGEKLQNLLAQLRPRLAQVSMAILRSGDAELEKRMNRFLTSEQAADVRRKLIARFGYCRLGQDPEKIILRLLSRGKIVSKSEAVLVLARLADQLHPGFGSTEYIKLRDCMAAYKPKPK